MAAAPAPTSAPDVPPPAAARPAAAAKGAFWPLISSRRLQQLELHDLHTDAPWREMFTAGLKLPHLRRLVITQDDETQWELKQLARCCPRLQHLDLLDSEWFSPRV
jgi:hypothetical protein